jgi:hypothetical protein
MLAHHLRVIFAVSIFTLAVVAVLAPVTTAQTTPRIENLFPPGAQRGTQVDVLLEGEFLPGVCQLTSSGGGVALKPTGSQDRFTFSVASGAKVGPHEVRLSCTQGASSPFPFIVGELPEIVRSDDSNSLELKFPVTVNSRLSSARGIDEYSLTLSADQQIVCAVAARAFRSPVDATLRLLDADRQLVATGFDHRSADSLLVYRAKKAGRYTLQVFNFQMGRGPQHIYRLTVTDGPWLDYAFPSGLQINAETPVTLYGWNLTSQPGHSVSHRIPPQPAGSFELTLPGGANRLTLPTSEHPERIEIEPNDAPEQAQPFEWPAIINGRLDKPGDVDVFSFSAAKGDRLAIEVDSAELQFPTDPVLSIIHENGKTLQEVDDNKTSRDPSLRFTVPSDGRFFVSLRDRSRGGAEDFVYRLGISRIRPDLKVRVNTTSFTLHSGKTSDLAVLVERLDGFEGEWEVTALDLPPGVSVKPQPVPAKTPATIQLPFTVAESQAPVSGLVRIVAREKDKETPAERIALIAETPQATSGSQALWLAVSPEIPFTLKTTTTILDAPRMAAFSFPVTAQRKEGFTGAIRLVGVEPDRRGTVVPLEGKIAADSDAGSIPLILQNQVTEGTTHRCRVMGIAEVPGTDGKTYPVFQIAAGGMSIGCQPSLLTMTVEPSVVIWRPGESVRIQVQLMRRVSMSPITLSLKLPTGVQGVTCEPIQVNETQSQVALTIHFSPDAVLPPRTTLSIKAESSRDGLPIYGTTSFRIESP